MNKYEIYSFLGVKNWKHMPELKNVKYFAIYQKYKYLFIYLKRYLIEDRFEFVPRIWVGNFKKRTNNYANIIETFEVMDFLNNMDLDEVLYKYNKFLYVKYTDINDKKEWNGYIEI